MKFSVIIPTYNRINFLENAIQSVLQQTYLNYEIIVVNDNPSDKLAIDKLVSQFSKVKVIHHNISKGGNAARNSGIAISDGDLIAFLDDDDIWLPQKLATHLKQHQDKTSVGLVYSDCRYTYNNPTINDYNSSAPLPDNIIKAMSIAEFCPATSSIVTIKRECVEKCGVFDDSLVSLQDWDYWFRIAHEFDFSYIPVVLVHFTQHPGDRTSHNEIKRRKGLSQILNKWQSEINIREFRRNLIRSIYYKNLRNALVAGKKFKAIKKSFNLLRPEVVGIKSLRNFYKMWVKIIKR